MRSPLAPGLLAALLCACGCARHQDGGEEPNETAEPVPVQVAPTRLAPFQETVKAIGIVGVVPAHLAEVSAAVEGTVLELVADQGDLVKAGDPIVRLDARLARGDLEEKQAARAREEAALALLKAPPREPERRLADLEVERARVAAEVARAVVERLEPLRAREEVSDQQLFEAKKRVEEAELARKAAEARREVLLLGPRPEAVAEGEARLASAEAAAKTSAARAGLFILTSPRDGVVDSILCHPGQTLSAGAGVARVVEVSEVLVVASVPPAEAARIEKGQEARVLGVGVGVGDHEAAGTQLPGRVVSSGLETTPGTGSVPVRILVKNPEARLRLGAAVRVEVVVRSVPESLAVPDEAIIPSEEGVLLLVVREGKAAALHPQVGLRHAGLSQVSGVDLKPGEPVITRGGYHLPEGTAVKAEAAPERAENSAR